MSKKLIIMTDIGDTIIDETTEIRKRSLRRPEGIVQTAQCIPGAKETMLKLYDAGYTIVMVADGYTESFHNTMKLNGLDHIFSAWITSEQVGIQKPSAHMFEAAMDAMHLTDSDKPRIIMVGNHVRKDIGGANRFGIRSVQIDWSKRHPYIPSCAEEQPTYLIHTPEELFPLCEKLESEL